MATKIYGASDDLIEFEGDVRGEVGCYADKEEDAYLIACDDGSMLKMWYGDDGIWKIRVLNKGQKFVGIEQCDNENADPHSDVATFRDGLKKCYVGKSCKEAK